jgi:hypothetical protein
MMMHYQYEFVRLQGKQRQEYQELIRQYAGKGWRLVQIFAPGAGGLWASADYIELIFEQKIESFAPESEGDAERVVD